MKKVGETHREKSREFLELLLDQDLVPNFRPKSPCKCPKLTKPADSYNNQITSKQGASNFDNTQGRQNINDNIPITVGKMQAQAQKQPRPQQVHKIRLE